MSLTWGRKEQTERAHGQDEGMAEGNAMNDLRWPGGVRLLNWAK